jgi:hypothetical protein
MAGNHRLFARHNSRSRCVLPNISVVTRLQESKTGEILPPLLFPPIKWVREQVDPALLAREGAQAGVVGEHDPDVRPAIKSPQLLEGCNSGDCVLVDGRGGVRGQRVGILIQRRPGQTQGPR